MTDQETQKLIACYTEWSAKYHQEWYGDDPRAFSPAVSLVNKHLNAKKALRILDAGCGSASMLRHLYTDGRVLHGFDLTPAMIDEARHALSALPGAHEAWVGDVTDRAAFNAPSEFKSHKGGHEEQRANASLYDVCLSVGVMTHIPEEADKALIENLVSATRPGGTVIVGIRNALMGLFSLNRYTWEFFEKELLPLTLYQDRAKEHGEDADTAIATLKSQLRMDMPPNRGRDGKAGGYDDLRARMHNPLVIEGLMKSAGVQNTRLLFYHYHPLPPWLRGYAPSAFDEVAESIENAEDWRGLFLASAALVMGDV